MPRVGLTRSAVVAAAADLVDAVGPERLTLAALAQQFGVKLPSLYKHVGGIDDVYRAVAVLAVDELGSALAEATVGRAGPDALRALAVAYRTYAKEHPGRYALSVRAPDPADAEHVAAAQRVSQTVFRALAAYRREGEDAVDAVRILRSALHGFATLETAGGFGLPRQVDRTFDRLVDALDLALSELAHEP